MMTYLPAIAVLSGLAGIPDRQDRALALRMSTRAGVDSNLLQSARSEGWAVASVIEGEGAADFLVGEDIVGMGVQLALDIGDGADRAHRFVLGAQASWSTLLWGRARYRSLGRGSSSSPHLRLVLRARYGLGLRLDTVEAEPSVPSEGDRDGDDDDDREDDDLGGLSAGATDELQRSGGLAFLSPFHDVGVDAKLLLRASRTTRLMAQLRLRRSFRSRDPGDPSPHFTEPGGELGARQAIFRGLDLEARYGVRVRGYDERENGRGDRLVRVTHLPRLGLRIRSGPLRLRLGYQAVFRDENRDGRKRMRHSVVAAARFRLSSRVTALMDLLQSTEERVGRPERSWTRFRGLVGVRFNFSHGEPRLRGYGGRAPQLSLL